MLEGLHQINFNIVDTLLKPFRQSDGIVVNYVRMKFGPCLDNRRYYSKSASTNFPTCVVIIFHNLLVFVIIITAPSVFCQRFGHFFIIVLVNEVWIVARKINRIFQQVVYNCLEITWASFYNHLDCCKTCF